MTIAGLPSKISRTFKQPENLRQQVIHWGPDMLLKFLDAFPPRIRNL